MFINIYICIYIYIFMVKRSFWACVFAHVFLEPCLSAYTAIMLRGSYWVLLFPVWLGFFAQTSFFGGARAWHDNNHPGFLPGEKKSHHAPATHRHK